MRSAAPGLPSNIVMFRLFRQYTTQTLTDGVGIPSFVYVLRIRAAHESICNGSLKGAAVALAPFAPLEGLRVVEVNDNSVAASYAGYLLAALGAQVFKVADPADAVSADVAYGLLDADKTTVEVPAGRGAAIEHLLNLTAGADAVITASVSSTDSLTVQFARELVRRRPATRLFSLVARAGEELAAPNCLISASAGMTWGIGEQSRDPLTVPAELAEYQSGVHLACCVVVDVGLVADDAQLGFAHHQIADLDIARHNVLENYSIMSTYGIPWEREGRRAAGSAGGYPYGIFPCKDGLVAIIARTHNEWGRLLDAMGRPQWANDPRFADMRVIAQKHADEADVHLIEWLRDLTRAEAAQVGREYGVPMGPVNTPIELLHDEHLRARNFFYRHSLADGRSIELPGMPFTVRVGTAAPANSTVTTTASRGADAFSRLPLHGRRVLDLTSTWSGPGVTAFLADLGAEVIKVESLVSLDTNRRRGFETPGMPVPDDLKTVPQSAMCAFDAFRILNRGKLSVQLSMKTVDGKTAFEDLIRVSDLIVENRTPGALERLGLGWERIQELNPACSLVTLSALGRGGPASATKGYGPIMSSYAGVESLARYDDEIVGMLTVAYSDANAIPWATLSAVSGLRLAQRTGAGVHIDISQTEASAATTFAPLVHAQLDIAEVWDYDPRPCVGVVIRCSDGWICAYVERGAAANTPRRSARSCAETVADFEAVGSRAARVLDYGEMYDGLLHESSHLIVDVVDKFGHDDRLSFVPWPSTICQPVPASAPLLNEHAVYVVEGVLGRSRRDLEALFASGAMY
jgi:crotonobetainyl-CoA:carnitine CoA-transferase CaiB-like acyl-CoA transferase